MKSFPPFLFLLSCLVLLTVGCKQGDAEILEDTTPKVVFAGAPDAKFAGTWKTEDGVSVYYLDRSGAYKLESKIQIPHQKKPMLTHLSGSWAIAGDRMLFKDQAGNVAGYAFESTPTKLTLISTGTLKAKTIMDRQP